MSIISVDTIAASNAPLLEQQKSDYAHLGGQLARRGVDIDAIKAKVKQFAVALPSWGSAPAAPGSRAFPAAANPATCSTNSRTAASSTS